MSAEEATRLDEQSIEAGHAFRQGHPRLQVVLSFVAGQQGQDGSHQQQLPSFAQVGNRIHGHVGQNASSSLLGRQHGLGNCLR